MRVYHDLDRQDMADGGFRPARRNHPTARDRDRSEPATWLTCHSRHETGTSARPVSSLTPGERGRGSFLTRRPLNARGATGAPRWQVPGGNVPLEGEEVESSPPPIRKDCFQLRPRIGEAADAEEFQAPPDVEQLRFRPARAVATPEGESEEEIVIWLPPEELDGGEDLEPDLGEIELVEADDEDLEGEDAMGWAVGVHREDGYLGTSLSDPDEDGETRHAYPRLVDWPESTDENPLDDGFGLDFDACVAHFEHLCSGPSRWAKNMALEDTRLETLITDPNLEGESSSPEDDPFRPMQRSLDDDVITLCAEQAVGESIEEEIQALLLALEARLEAYFPASSWSGSKMPTRRAVSAAPTRSAVQPLLSAW